MMGKSIKTRLKERLRPGVPIVVRINGRIEEFHSRSTAVKKRDGYSDIIVSRSCNGKVVFRGRLIRISEDVKGHLLVPVTLTPNQAKVVLEVMKFEFPE